MSFHICLHEDNKRPKDDLSDFCLVIGSYKKKDDIKNKKPNRTVVQARTFMSNKNIVPTAINAPKIAPICSQNIIRENTTENLLCFLQSDSVSYISASFVPEFKEPARPPMTLAKIRITVPYDDTLPDNAVKK